METSNRSTAFSWGGLIFGAAFALVCTVLILTGVVGGGIWWTVLAMVLLALSSAINLVSEKRRRSATQKR